MKNRIHGTEYERYIARVTTANLDAVDASRYTRWHVEARLKMAAEAAESTSLVGGE
jgi:hypothetical protein